MKFKGEQNMATNFYGILTETTPALTLGDGFEAEFIDAAGAQTINVADGASLNLSGANGENIINLEGDAADYTVSGDGFGNMTFTNTVTGGVITMAATASPQTLVFGDGSADLGISGSDVVLGDQIITSSAAEALTATLDVNETSDAAFGVVDVPAASFSISDATVAENGATATFTVTLSTAPVAADGDITVNYATAAGTATEGTDYTATSGMLTFNAASGTTQTITVPIIDDFAVEADETFTVNLSGQTGTIGGKAATISDAAGTGTITNDDVAVASYTLTESINKVTEGSSITYTVTALDADGNATAVLADTSFTYTMAGDTLNGAATAADASDVNPASGTITLTAGQSTVTFTVDAIDDGNTEGLEGMKISILDGDFVTVASETSAIEDAAGGSQNTYTLTTSADNFTGTTGDDTFNGAVSATAAVNTFGLTDTLAGGAGTDVLNITTEVLAADISIPAANVSAIETFNIRSLVADGVSSNATIMDASLYSGLTKVVSDRSTETFTVTKLATGATFGIKGDALVTNGDSNFAYATATTPITLEVSGGTKAGTVTGTASTGVQTATINVTGSVANNLTAIELDNAANGSTITSLTINAAAGLTTALDAGDFAATGALTVTGAASTPYAGSLAAVNLGANFDGKTVDASAMTAGGVQMSLNSNLTSFKGGQGSDVVTITAIASTTAGAVDGGAGTDTLVSTKSDWLDTSSEAAVFTTFERLSATDGASDVDTDTYDMSLLTSITALEVGVMSHVDDDVIFNKMTAAQASDVTVTGDNTLNDLTFALANSTGTSDALTLNLKSATSTSNVDVSLLTMTGFESLTVNATTGTAGTSSDVAFKAAGADKLTSVTLQGSADIGLSGTNTSKAMTVNGSTMTGKATIAGNFVTGSTVTTGSGADAIALGTGFATYNAGAGNDNFTATTVASINTGTSYNVMNGGEGTDTLTLTAAAVSMVDDNFKSLSGLEKFVVDADADGGGAGDVSLVTGGWYNTAFATNGSDVTVLGDDGDALTFTGSSFTGNQKLSVTTASDGATTADNVVIATGSGADTVTVTASSWVGHATTAGIMTIATGDGNDTINVTTGILLGTDEANGEILGITAGKGADNITISHTNAAAGAGSATFTIAAGDSTQTAYDTITGFKMGDIAGTDGKISDGLDFGTAAISGAVTTTAVTGFTAAELAITIATTGKATFSGTQAATITDSQALTAIDQVITNGKTAFYTDGTDTFVFNADASGDSVVELIGVAADTLLTTNDATTDNSIFIV